jgi:hypothetical protein
MFLSWPGRAEIPVSGHLTGINESHLKRSEWRIEHRLGVSKQDRD